MEPTSLPPTPQRRGNDRSNGPPAGVPRFSRLGKWLTSVHRQLLTLGRMSCKSFSAGPSTFNILFFQTGENKSHKEVMAAPDTWPTVSNLNKEKDLAGSSDPQPDCGCPLEQSKFTPKGFSLVSERGMESGRQTAWESGKSWRGAGF